MKRQSWNLMLSIVLVATFAVALPSKAWAQSRNIATQAAGEASPPRTVQAVTHLRTVWEEPLFPGPPQQPGPQPTKPRRDSLWNGLLIGAGIGALLGLIPDYYDDCEECHDSLYASIAVGAGVGLLIGVLRSGRPSPSRSSKREDSGMDVMLEPRKFGLTGRIVWR